MTKKINQTPLKKNKSRNEPIHLDVFLQAVYNVTVYFKGSGVRSPR